jgi:anti-sigma B factor antagonist
VTGSLEDMSTGAGEPPGLRLSTEDSPDGPVLSVQGEVDVYTCPSLREELYRLIDGGAARVVVDLSGMDFIDSSGLGVFVGALKRIRELSPDRTLELRNLPPAARKVFDITGLTDVFGIAP